jgi:hypothetical protein
MCYYQMRAILIRDGNSMYNYFVFSFILFFIQWFLIYFCCFVFTSTHPTTTKSLKRARVRIHKPRLFVYGHTFFCFVVTAGCQMSGQQQSTSEWGSYRNFRGSWSRATASPCSLGLSATGQQYFSLRTNQPPATSQQYFSLRTNQQQPSASSQTNRL